MCYNQSVSWLAFITASIFNIVLIYLAVSLGNLAVALLALAFTSVILVQLFEALAWRGFEGIGANGVLLCTVLQPIVIGLILSYLPVDQWKKIVVTTVIILYLIYIIYSMNNTSNFEQLETNERCPHLVYSFWSKFFLGPAPYLIAMFLVLALLLSGNLRLIVILFGILTLLLSWFLYPCGAGSLWCLYAAGLPIILVLILIFKPELLN